MPRKRTPEQDRLLTVVSTIETRAQVFERDMNETLDTCRREIALGVGVTLSGGILLGAVIGALLGRRGR
jgi:hypothetical protein